uniref:Ig-like domain-containing protein n=1 Tax=Monodelphis domestica TaxID=13616 RepID=F6QEC4_MONDO
LPKSFRVRLYLPDPLGQEEVTQSPQFLIVQEGDHVSMNCSYTNNAYTYFLWYKQDSGKGPDFQMDIRSNMDKKGNRRMTILLDKGAKLLSLNIMDAQPGDSSTYLCVASTQCFLSICSLCRNPTVGVPASFPDFQHRL